MKIVCTENQYQIAEAIEFDAVKGKGVDTENKKNSSQYHKEAEKKIKDYDGGLNEDSSFKIGDANDSEEANKVYSKGMERLKYDTPPSKHFKERVAAQMLGKPSALAEDGDGEGSGASSEGNEAFLKQTIALNKYDDDHTGVGKDNNALLQFGDDIEVLQGTKPKTKMSAYENKIPRLNFKKSTFLNEEHMISLIPDGYKINENKFIMRDNTNNMFLVEWKEDKAVIVNDKKEENVEENKFPKQINEEIDRIKNLWNYNSSYHFNNKANSGRGVTIDMNVFKK